MEKELNVDENIDDIETTIEVAAVDEESFAEEEEPEVGANYVAEPEELVIEEHWRKNWCLMRQWLL